MTISHSAVLEIRAPKGVAFRLLTPGLVAGFGAIALVLIAMLVLSPANLRRVYGSAEAVAHTQAVKAALQGLLTTAVDAETGQRGFIITGDASYLEPYDRSRDSISARITQVRTLTADNPAQQEDLERLFAIAAARIDVLAEALTSMAREEDRRDALHAGFELHLTKPVDAPSLVEAVAMLARKTRVSKD